MKSNLHAVYGLAFVPVDDVSNGWTCLKVKSLLIQYPATAAFITYFESTWINNTAYPIKMWNHYDITLSDDPRTNNFSEGSNSALNTATGCSSPTIPRPMDMLCRFNAENPTNIYLPSSYEKTTEQGHKAQRKNQENSRGLQLSQHCNLLPNADHSVTFTSEHN